MKPSNIIRGREHIGETTKQDFRISHEEKEEYQTISDYIVRSGDRGQRGATKAILFKWLCSRNPKSIRRLAQRLIEYADMLERTGTGKDSEVNPQRRPGPFSHEPSLCYSTVDCKQ